MKKILLNTILFLSMYVQLLATTLEEKDIGCQEGNATECFYLGIKYEDGDGVEVDDVRALEYLIKACNGGHGLSCMGIGIRYVRAKGVDRNHTKAVKYFTKGCESEVLPCAMLGTMYAHGKGVEKDLNKSIELYEKACDAGEKMGCTYLAEAYQAGFGVKKDSNEKLYYQDKACTAGDKHSCSNLGNTYINGRDGVKQDYVKAIKYYKKSCEKLSARGCANVGALYERGFGVKQNFKQAMHYYTLACTHSDASGCSNLGILYEQGKGTAKDFVKAEMLYSIACKDNDASACYNLALMYDTGEAIEQNYAKALKAYEKSCEGNYVKACSNLGLMYASGKGIVKDYAKAKTLWEKACEGGNELACKNYKKIRTLSQPIATGDDVDKYIKTIQHMVDNNKSEIYVAEKSYIGYTLFLDNKDTFSKFNDALLSIFSKNNWKIKSLVTSMHLSYDTLSIENFDTFFEQLSDLSRQDKGKNKYWDRILDDLPYAYLDYMDNRLEKILLSDKNVSLVTLYDLEGKEVNSTKHSREYLVSEGYKRISEFYEEREEDDLTLKYAKKAMDTCTLNPDAMFHYAYSIDNPKLELELLEKIVLLTATNDTLLNRDAYSLHNNIGYALWGTGNTDKYDQALGYLQKAYDVSEGEGVNSLGTMASIYLEQKKFKEAYEILKTPLSTFFHATPEELEEYSDESYWYFIRAAIDTSYALKDYNATKFICKRYLAMKDKAYEECVTMLREIDSLPVNTAMRGEFSYWDFMTESQKNDKDKK